MGLFGRYVVLIRYQGVRIFELHVVRKRFTLHLLAWSVLLIGGRSVKMLTSPSFLAKNAVLHMLQTKTGGEFHNYVQDSNYQAQNKLRTTKPAQNTTKFSTSHATDEKQVEDSTTLSRLELPSTKLTLNSQITKPA